MRRFEKSLILEVPVIVEGRKMTTSRPNSSAIPSKRSHSYLLFLGEETKIRKVLVTRIKSESRE